MTTYVCTELAPTVNGGYVACKHWVVQSNFINELSRLTYQDTNVLLSYTALLFATAWLYKRLSLNASRM